MRSPLYIGPECEIIPDGDTRFFYGTKVAIFFEGTTPNETVATAAGSLRASPYVSFAKVRPQEAKVAGALCADAITVIPRRAENAGAVVSHVRAEFGHLVADAVVSEYEY